ncbi:MAG: AAA family ATPase [Clostridia bacterium]|nr:AAA family ATPase [Clostridia bacterium]
MQDSKFGMKLYELRKKRGLSQAELGKILHVTNKAVSKWENGKAEPSLDMVKTISDALNVTVSELLETPKSEKKVSKIVITGGPCAGKTTAMSWIQNAFTRLGYAVLFVDETATQLISGGAAPWLSLSGRDFQRWLTHLQLEKEKAFAEIGRTFKNDKILVVCDRGALDNRAYMSEADFQAVLKALDTNEVSLRDQYDAVFHLVTAAKGAERFYTLANNAARTETPEQAAALDDQLIAAWTGHPHLRVIDNSTDFDEKMRRLIGEISSFLGEPEPLEIERKYLIKYPDVKALEKLPNCQKVDILQIYLQCSGEAEEMRIRQRGQDGHYIYFKTRKKKVSEGKRIEIEERLTQEEFLSLMSLADPAYRPIRKERYCLSENGLYYEIDVYPEWKHQAILEVELRDESQQITYPEMVKVIREVTGDDAFSNHALAKIS